MSIFKSILQKTSSTKNISLLFIVSHLVLLVMMVFTFPIINKQIQTNAFDLHFFGYSVTTARSIVQHLTFQTTQLYLFPQLTLFDVFYPILLALFLSGLLFRLIKTDNKLRKAIVYVPFLAMIFDYFENICIILMITKTVEVSESIVYLSSSFTILKSMLTTISWIAILIYAMKLTIVKIQKKKMSL